MDRNNLVILITYFLSIITIMILATDDERM